MAILRKRQPEYNQAESDVLSLESAMPDTKLDPADAAWAASQLEELDQRVLRLENAVAELCDTQVLEDRIRGKVLEELHAVLEKKRKEELAARASAAAEAGAQAPASGDVTLLGSVSVFGEVLADLRLFFRMAKDPYYQTGLLTKMVPILPALFILWTAVFGHFLPLVGYVVDVLLIVALSFLVFKVWGRELRRYRAFLTRRGR